MTFLAYICISYLRDIAKEIFVNMWSTGIESKLPQISKVVAFASKRTIGGIGINNGSLPPFEVFILVNKNSNAVHHGNLLCSLRTSASSFVFNNVQCISSLRCDLL